MVKTTLQTHSSYNSTQTNPHQWISSYTDTHLPQCSSISSYTCSPVLASNSRPPGSTSGWRTPSVSCFPWSRGCAADSPGWCPPWWRAFLGLSLGRRASRRHALECCCLWGGRVLLSAPPLGPGNFIWVVVLGWKCTRILGRTQTNTLHSIRSFWILSGERTNPLF